MTLYNGYWNLFPHASPDMPLRIALLAYRGKPHCGGQGVYVRHLSKALVDLGHHVEVFGGQPYPVLDPRVPLHELRSLDIFNDAFPGRIPGFWEIKSWADLAEVASFTTGTFSEPLAFSIRAWQALRPRLDDFDLVHDNQTLGYGLLAIERDASRFSAPSTTPSPSTGGSRSSTPATGSSGSEAALVRLHEDADARRQAASPGGHRLGVFPQRHPPRPRRALRPHDRRSRRCRPRALRPSPRHPAPAGKILTTASADVAMKGLRYLLEAVAKLRTERPVSLTVIGRPREGGAVADTLARLGLDDAVEFVSGVSDERIVELYAEAQVAVVPSLYEGFSLPAIEAMATTVPLVATTGGALPEVAGTDGETAVLVTPGDSDALAAGLRRVLDDDDLARRIGLAGRERVINRWSWHHTARHTVDQYRLLLDEAARGHRSR